MRNVSGKSGTENHKAHFTFNIFFPKVVPFIRWSGTILQCRTGHIWQYKNGV